MDKINKFIKIINPGTYINGKYKFTKFRSEFVLENIESATNPEEILKKLIQYCVDQTKTESKKQGMEVDQIGVSISSSLLDYDIYTPIRKITENTSEAILNLFLKVSQSKGRDGSLLGEPFTIVVTGVCCADLPLTRTIVGSGKTKKNTTGFRPKNINEAFLIKTDNKDRYCLFYALEIMRIYASNELTALQFFRYKNNTEKRRIDVMKLLKNANIPTNLASYDATKWCPIVQTYYDHAYGPKLFKIFIFRNHSYKPIFSTKVQDYKFPILLYHHDNHFDGIRTISKFFNREKYCLSCECPYDRNSRHSIVCKARCRNCAGTGPEFPCKAFPHLKKCSDCKKILKNYSCFKIH